MEELLKPYVGEIITAFVGVIVWFFQRKKHDTELKKQKVETNTNEIENAEKALQYYRSMVDDLGKRLTLAILELNQSMKMVKDLQIQVEELTRELKKYKQLSGKL